MKKMVIIENEGWEGVRKAMYKRGEISGWRKPAPNQEAGNRSFLGFLAAAFFIIGVMSVFLLPSEGFAGVHQLLVYTNDSTNPIKTGVEQQMVNITTNGVSGGNDVTRVVVNLYGGITTADVAGIYVYYGGALVGSVTSISSTSFINIDVPGNQKGGSPWDFKLKLKDSAEGKTVQLEIYQMTGSDGIGLPNMTSTKNIKLGCSAKAPSDLALFSKTANSVTMTWTTDFAKNSYYKVYRQSQSESAMTLVSTNVSSVPFTNGGLIELTKYGFIVNGYDVANGCDSLESNTLISATLSANKFQITTCGGCHTTPPDDTKGTRGIPDGATIGRHANPYHTGGISSGEGACILCHVDHAGKPSHLDGYVQMNTTNLFGQSGSFYDKNRNGTYDTGIDNVFIVDNLPISGADLSDLGTCRATWCHGSRSSSPVWGSSSGKEQCLMCHGMSYGTVAIDTEGHTAATDPEVGEHNNHMHTAPGFLNISTANSCNQCHIVPNRHTDAGHYDNASPAEIIFGPLATNEGVYTGYYNYTTRICSNVYCHDGRLFKNKWADASQVVNPQWNDPNFLNSGGTSWNCTNRCHGYPPLSPHDQVNLNCSGCHPSVASDDVSFTPYKYYEHVDGVVQGYVCTSCHGQPPMNSSTMVNVPDPETSRRTQYPATGGAGRHDKHGEFVADCITCHAGGSSFGQHNTDPLTYVDIGFIICGVERSGWYQAPDFTATAYDLRNAPLTKLNIVAGGRVCSNYCHSDGGNYAGTFAYKIVGWDSGTLVASCNKCHGSGNQWALTDKHPKHAGTYAIKCVDCHSKTVNVSNGIIGNHMDAVKNVGLSEGTYNRPTCQSTYCHSPGNKASGYDAPQQSAQWNSTAGCNACHGGGAHLGSPIATGSHRSHINNAGLLGRNQTCQACHNRTAVGNAVGTNSSFILNHVDRMVAVEFSGGANATGQYNGTAFSKRGVGNAARSCSALYCHSTGKANAVAISNLPSAYGGSHFTNVAWGGAGIGCDGCHGKTSTTAGRGWPDYTSNPINNGTSQANSHATGSHKGTFCGTCHVETVASGTDSPIKSGSTRHLNGSAVSDVIFNTGVGGGSGAWYNTTTKACSSITCHGALVWGGVGGCGSCHGNPPPAVLSDSSRSTQFPATPGGRHDIHNSAGYTTCSSCHQGGGSGGSHSDGTKNVNMGFTYGNSTGVYNAPAYSSIYNLVSGSGGTTVNKTGSTRICSGIYCHSNARSDVAKTYTTANWDASTTGACNICHSRPSDATRTWTTSHDKHTKTYGQRINCNNCHKDTAINNSTISNKVLHVNNTKNVVFNAAAGGSPVYNGATRTCSAVYCHSDGRTPTGYASVNWIGATTTCTSCHGSVNNSTGGASTSLTAAHAAHTNTVYANRCADCHNSVVNFSNVITSVTLHANSAKNVAIAAANGSGATYGGNTSCTSTNCHGSRSAAWGSASTGGADACTVCHGVLTANTGDGLAFANRRAPGALGTGTSTNGATAANDTKVGAHRTHLENLSNYSFGMQCSNCHIVPGSVLAAGHIDNALPAEIRFGGLATNGGAVPSYNYSTGVCSGTYCHNRPGAINQNAVVWTNTTYLSGTPGDNDNGTGDCERCHGCPPVDANHSGQALSVCSTCHPHFNASGGLVDRSLHIDGKKDGLSCTGCHGQPPLSTATMVNAAATFKTTGRTSQFATTFSGRHSSHQVTRGYACAVCHTGGGSTSGQHNNSVSPTILNVGFSYLSYVSGWYQAPAFSNTNYILRTGHANTTVSTVAGGRVCNNIYCHSDGGNYAGTFTYKQANWDQPGSYSCTGCHGSGSQYATTNAHPKHIDGGGYNVKCQVCHNMTVAINNTVIGNHVNGVKNVAWSGDTRVAGAPAYNRPNCATLYCHSDGKTSASYASPTWNGATTTCTSCHGGMNNATGGATTSLTAAHAAHTNTVYGYRCADCHASVVNFSNVVTATGFALHVDKLKNVSILAANGSGATYGGNTSCTSTNCHGSRSAAWGGASTGGADACTVCHGVLTANTGDTLAFANRRAPGALGTGTSTNGATAATDLKVGAHRTHLENLSNFSFGMQCSNCHIVPGSVKAAGHIDSALPAEINFGGLSTTGGVIPSYNYSTRVCSGTYCHNRPGATNQNGVVWTNTAYIASSTPTDTNNGLGTCEKCHGCPPVDGNHSGQALTGCSECHGMVVSSTGYIIDRSLHIDGKADAAGSCKGCHSAQKGARRATNGASGDFVRQSRHVSNGTAAEIVTDFDCVVCHVEGNLASAGTNISLTAEHKDQAGAIKNTIGLRNLDSPANPGTLDTNFWRWPGRTSATTTDRQNMDKFCLSCHDADGSLVAVNNTNNGLLIGLTNTAVTRTATGGGNSNVGNANTRLRPFNTLDNLQNMFDGTHTGGSAPNLANFRTIAYGRVLNVKSQFNSTNQVGKNWASHHNLSIFQRRYTSRNATAWPAAAWTTYVTKQGVTINSATGGELSYLHCSDCHLNEVNAHGTVKAWYMLVNNTVALDPQGISDTDPPPYADSATTHTNSCFRCHAGAAYAFNGASTTVPRVAHGTGRCNSIDAANEYPFMNPCQACHGGWAEAGGVAQGALVNAAGANITGALGSIHGTNVSYFPNKGATASKRYRFMSGAAMRYYGPAGATYSAETDWENASGNPQCYTIIAGENQTWSSCTSHSGGGATTNAINRARTLQY